MIGLENQTLRSRRLTYRLLCDADRAPLRALLSDRRVTEPAGFLPAETPEQFDAFFAALTQYRTGVAVLLGETLIGYIHVNRCAVDLPAYRDSRGVSTGFVIGDAYRNRGYATETLATLTEWLLRRFDYCVADHFEGNEPSRRVIEKCGYRYIETYAMFFDELGREMTCRSYLKSAREEHTP